MFQSYLISELGTRFLMTRSRYSRYSNRYIAFHHYRSIASLASPPDMISEGYLPL